jgi:hypothetical protein
MADNGSSAQIDLLRVKYGYRIVISGLVLVVVVFAVGILKMDKPCADVATLVTSVTGVIGTIVGAFFGVHAGSAGKGKADDDRNKAVDLALHLAAACPHDVAAGILEQWRTRCK